MINMKETRKPDTLLSECCSTDQPEYPYGLCLSLNSDTLDRLGMTELPEIGTVLTLHARVEVTSVSQYERADGKNRDVSLQITDMDLNQEGAAPNAQRMYTNSNMT